MAKETDYTAKILTELRKDKNFYAFKYVQSGFSRIGVPDLIICYKGLFIGAEVKMVGNDFSDQQVYNIMLINKAGGCGIGLWVAPKSKVSQTQYAVDIHPETKEGRETLEWVSLPDLIHSIKDLKI